MAKVHTYEIVGPEFLSDSGKAKQVRAAMPYPATTVWAALKDNEAWKAMLPVDTVEWLEPISPTTSRVIGSKGKDMIERFYEWEEGKSFAFYLESGSVGALKAMAERYEVVPINAENSEVQITFRIQTKGLAKPLGPLFSGIFKLAGKSAMKKLSKYIDGSV